MERKLRYSKWTSNLKKGVLKRSPAYQAFIERNEEAQRKQMHRQNWKMEQIALLKKDRAIAERMATRPSTISPEAAQQTSNHIQGKALD